MRHVVLGTEVGASFALYCNLSLQYVQLYKLFCFQLSLVENTNVSLELQFVSETFPFDCHFSVTSLITIKMAVAKVGQAWRVLDSM